MRCSIESTVRPSGENANPPVGRRCIANGTVGIPHRQRPHSTGRDVDERQAGPGRRLAGANQARPPFPDDRGERRAIGRERVVVTSGQREADRRPALVRSRVDQDETAHTVADEERPTIGGTLDAGRALGDELGAGLGARSEDRGRLPPAHRDCGGRAQDGGEEVAPRLGGRMDRLSLARGGASGRASPRSARVEPSSCAWAVVASSSARLRARTARPPAMIASESKLATPPSNARRRRFVPLAHGLGLARSAARREELPLELVELRSVSLLHSRVDASLAPRSRSPGSRPPRTHASADVVTLRRTARPCASSSSHPRNRGHSRKSASCATSTTPSLTATRRARRRGRRAPRAPRGRRRAHRMANGVERRRRSALHPRAGAGRVGLRLAPPG